MDKRIKSIKRIFIPDPNYIFVSCTECKYRTTCDHRGRCRIRQELGEPEVQPYIEKKVVEYYDGSKDKMNAKEASKYCMDTIIKLTKGISLTDD